MTRTQAQIITAVRERLDEPTEGQWKDKELRRWINKATRDICRRTECLDTVSLLAATSGTSTVAAPADTIRISRVEWAPDSAPTKRFPLEYRDFNAMDPIWYADRLITSSQPMYWTTQGFVPSLSIRLYPVPPEDGDIQVKYYKYPADLATDTSADANTTVTIPEGWDDAVEDYVEMMALRKDRDPRWQEAKSMYEEAAETLYGLSRRLTDQHGQVIPDTLGGSNLPAWLTGGY